MKMVKNMTKLIVEKKKKTTKKKTTLKMKKKMKKQSMYPTKKTRIRLMIKKYQD